MSLPETLDLSTSNNVYNLSAILTINNKRAELFKCRMRFYVPIQILSIILNWRPNIGERGMSNHIKNIMFVFAVFVAISFSKAAETVALDVGDAAPTFHAKDDQGKDFESQLVLGEKNLVIYFYPAAMTGGCTAQACAFRDDMEKFENLNTNVVGVSGDSVINLTYFKQVNNLNFPLLADPSGTIAKAFGVPTRGGGEITRTIANQQVKLVHSITEARWTFIIDNEGKIIYKDTDVKASNDSENVLKFLKSHVTSTAK